MKLVNATQNKSTKKYMVGARNVKRLHTKGANKSVYITV